MYTKIYKSIRYGVLRCGSKLFVHVVQLGSREMQYIPTTVIPISTISTRCPPAMRDSRENENNDEAKIGASPRVPEETI